MTSPFTGDPAGQRVNWLLAYLGVQKTYDIKVKRALLAAELDAAKAMVKLSGDNIGDRTKRYQVSLVRSELRDIINALFKGMTPLIRAGQADAAGAAAKAALKEDAKVLKALFPDTKMRKDYEESFTATARHSIQAMINRVAGVSPAYPLSSRVYRSAALSRGQVDRAINNHLARGTSAQELARDIRNLIKPSTPGGVSYAAMRLARTEINNAFHAQSIGAAQDSPWVTDMEWHMSKVHKPDPGDLCEEWDGQKFAKADVPAKPHPQCMCYVTPVMVSWNLFAMNLQAGAYDSYYNQIRRVA